MKKLIFLFIILCSIISNAQTNTGTCTDAAGFVTSIAGPCTVAANELLVAFVEACSSAVSGSGCYQPIHADPTPGISSTGSIVWHQLNSAAISGSTGAGQCNFTSPLLCDDDYTTFWAVTGATTGSITVTGTASVSTQIVWFVARFSGVTSTPFDASTSSTGNSVGGASSYTDGSLIINGNTFTAIVPYSASNVNGQIAVLFMAFRSSTTGKELLVIVDAANTANANLNLLPTGFANVSPRPSNITGFNNMQFNIGTLASVNVPRKKGMIF